MGDTPSPMFDRHSGKLGTVSVIHFPNVAEPGDIHGRFPQSLSQAGARNMVGKRGPVIQLQVTFVRLEKSRLE